MSKRLLDPSRFDSKITLLLSVFLIGALAYNLQNQFFQTEHLETNQEPVYQSVEQPASEAEVLGMWSQRHRSISISDRNYGNNGGVISLASTDEPTIRISSWGLSGQVDVDVYQAGLNSIFDYLMHDEENNQLRPNIDLSSLTKLLSTKHNLSPDGSGDETLSLPLEESGIYAVHVRQGEHEAYGYVIRSNTGVVLKEGRGEYLFWGQDYHSQRSISEGRLTLYSFQGQTRILHETTFDQNGIAKTPLMPEADIAIVERDNSITIVPINLVYLNTRYAYQRFQEQQRLSRYFVFTDRPLYSPGDTINFKAILRDDDDARYSLPNRSAQVTVSTGWGDDRKVIYDKNIPFSDYGSLDDSVNIPEGATTGYYTLNVDAGKSSPGSWQHSSSSANFQIEYFRKPEYTLDIELDQFEYISQDNIDFSVIGEYFSGQPLTGSKVNYEVSRGDYHEYDYWREESRLVRQEYRYGYWRSNSYETDSVSLDNLGRGQVSLTAKTASTSNQVFLISANYMDSTGNPVVARKNVLVYAGEYSIYRKPGTHSGRVNEAYNLPVTLRQNTDTNLSGVELTVKPARTEWIKYQEPDKKYASYRQETQELDEVSITTSQNGEATFSFTPTEPGSYSFQVSGRDSRDNLIIKMFHAWIVKPGKPIYFGEHQNELTIKADKEIYEPGDTARLTIQSNSPDRDVFVTLERGRLNRYLIAKLEGSQHTFTLPIVETDMPNIFATASSFSPLDLDQSSVNLPVSTESKRLNVQLTPDKDRYGPGDTMTLNVYTTDKSGNPLPAELAVWSVDKAIFELADSELKDIHRAFWDERYNQTVSAHSLEGISVLTAEGGGGCFVAGTGILMADGSLKPIEQVKAGDKILTRSKPNQFKLTSATVNSTHQAQADGYLIINNTLEVTPNHRLWVNQSWATAGSIQVGDILNNDKGQEEEVSSIAWINRPTTVYNFEVDRYQTYFADGIYVHNQKGGDRTVFEDTAYWNARVRTNDSGQAQLRFTLPDNLTTWVVSAVGATRDTVVGQMETEVVVSKDIVIRPVLPNILRENDVVNLEAMAHNFTDQDRIFNVSLSFDSGDIKVATHSAITIPANSHQSIYWTTTPNKVNPKATFRFSLWDELDDSYSDAVVQNLPVRPFGFSVKRGMTGTGDASYHIQLADDVDQDLSSVKLSLSPTLLGTLPDAMQYLIGYPYGCVEQTISRLIPAILVAQNPQLFSSISEDHDMNKIVETGLERLKTLQKPDGGWSWWSTGQSDVLISVYVLENLLNAQEAGFKIDQSMLSKSKTYFQNFEPSSNQTSKGLSPKEQAVAMQYGLYLLFPESPKSFVTGLEQLDIDLLSRSIILNLKNGATSSQQSGISELMSRVKTEGESFYWDSAPQTRFGSISASTAMALRSLNASQEVDAATRAVRYLSQNRKDRYWHNTFGTAQVMQALVDQANTTGELTPDSTYAVSLNGSQTSSGAFTSANQRREINIPLATIQSTGSTLKVSVGGQTPVYSTLFIDEFRTDRNALPEGNGMTITRQYKNMTSPNMTPIPGDTVRVTLNIKGLSGETNYIVVEDQLPAGMIPINPGFANERSSTNSWLWANNVSGREITENGMVVSLNRVNESHYVEYEARVISQGTFAIPPAQASLMYAPEVWARTGTDTITIEDVAKPVSKQDSLYTTSSEAIVDSPWLIAALVGLGIMTFGLIGYRFYLSRKPDELSVSQNEEPIPTDPEDNLLQDND